jgi:hypothetical protein
MNIEKILLIVIIIYLIFSHFKKNKNIENFAFSDTDKNEIRTIIKEIYNTDMDAIRTLADFAKKIQDGNNLTIPGNLTVTGTITGNSSLSANSLSITNNISSNHIYTKTLDIKGKHGTTHFNYSDSGTTYIRDDVQIYDHLYTKRLDIKAQRGTTHFNYNDGGNTYLKDNIEDSSNLLKNNININLEAVSKPGFKFTLNPVNNETLGVFNQSSFSVPYFGTFYPNYNWKIIKS